MQTEIQAVNRVFELFEIKTKDLVEHQHPNSFNIKSKAIAFYALQRLITTCEKHDMRFVIKGSTNEWCHLVFFIN